jgi:ABC-type Fe3+ transport system substrate-binding protein
MSATQEEGRLRYLIARRASEKHAPDTKDVVWPQDQWGMEAKAEAELLMDYSSPLADVEAWFYSLGRKKTRQHGAE